LKTLFFDTVKDLQLSYTEICTQVDTTQESQDYGWLGAIPSIREFIDERVAKGMAEFGFILRDKTWEATIAIERRAIENDQYGAINLKVKMLADAMVKGVNKLAWTVLREGNTGTYGRSWDNYQTDGTLSSATIYFNDTDHAYPAPAEYTTAHANKAANALSGANFWLAYQAMKAFKDDRGEYIDNVPNLLVCSPKVESTGLEIIKSPQGGIDGSKMYINSVAETSVNRVIAPAYWSADTAGNTSNWGLYKTNGIVKPLILQLFTPAANGQLFEFTSLTQGEEAFMRDKWLFGIRGRWNIGYGDWRTSYLNVVA
jgi:phage major head subunit gpT-like protein